MHYGMMIRSLDQPDDLCRMQCEASFANENFATSSLQYDEITKDDLLNMFKIWSNENRFTLSEVIPLEDNQEV